jgi:glycosyltransferase involved in cell wall biosynthesis
MKENFELNIFNEFYPDIPHNFNQVAVNDPRVNFWGKTPRKMVYKFMEESHIHAYPSTYPETSCLTQIEALSAGCYAVYSDLGALPETSMGHGVMIPSNELTPKRYAEELDKAIRMVKTHGYDHTEQVKDMHNNFSWNKAKQNWLAFDATI